jgi:hypothetical protein
LGILDVDIFFYILGQTLNCLALKKNLYAVYFGKEGVHGNNSEIHALRKEDDEKNLEIVSR